MVVGRRVVLGIGLLLLAGCAGKPDKAALEKKISENMAKSPEWKDVKAEMMLDATLPSIGANHEVDGTTYWFSFNGKDGNGGVAVRSPLGAVLCKYFFEQGKEVKAEKVEGSDEDLAKLRPAAAEFCKVCIAASRG